MRKGLGGNNWERNNPIIGFKHWSQLTNLVPKQKKSSKARVIRKANVIYCLSIPGTGLVICEHALFWLDAQLLCKKDDDNFHENLVHHTINAKQRHNILHIFFYYFVRCIYFKIESAKTNSCSESIPAHEQSSSNIYQIVGLPLEKRKNKTKKVLCLDTRSHAKRCVTSCCINPYAI